jgi:hypothetical protein
MATKQGQKKTTDPKVLKLEFCVNCPKEGKHIPIRGNCIDLVDAGHMPCPNPVQVYVPLFGGSSADIEPELVALPCLNGSSHLRSLYKIVKLCPHFADVTEGAVTHILRRVNCSYLNPSV